VQSSGGLKRSCSRRSPVQTMTPRTVDNRSVRALRRLAKPTGTSAASLDIARGDNRRDGRGRLAQRGGATTATMNAAAPPHDTDVERALLGAALVLGHVPPVLLEINRAAFYREGHKPILDAMRRLHGRGEPIDPMLLTRELGEQIEDAGGAGYVYKLTDGVPRSTNVEYYAHIVRQTWAARRALDVLDATASAIQEDYTVVGNGLPQLHAERWAEVTESPRTVTARAMTMHELSAFVFPARRVLLTRAGIPVIRAGSLGEIHALRGTGKTLFARSIEIAAATGTSAFGFEAPEPCRVLRVDGEMLGIDLKARDEQLGLALNVAPCENLVTIAADWQETPFPRLDTAKGQAFIEPFVEAADLIVLDNRSCLFDPEAEKDPTAWAPAQEWLLSLRRRGKAVITVRHSNRTGGARGHSKSEDVIDVSMKLSRPDNYRASQGARFRVEFDKARGVYGAAVEAFVTSLATDGWIVEGAASGPERRLREYLRSAGDARDRPKSATAAIAAARVQKKAGLKVWAAMLHRREIVQHPEGGFGLAE